MDWLTILIIISANVLAVFLTSYFTRKGSNRADKEDIQKISYESEIGKNLATKEDIEEITHKIENIKYEISFENQRKHLFIEQRKERFLKILRLAEHIKGYDQMLFYYFHDDSSAQKLAELIKDVNDTMMDLVHENRLLMVSHRDSDILKITSRLISECDKYCTFLCVTANNAKNAMYAIKSAMSYLDNDSAVNSVAKVLTERRNDLENLKKAYLEEKGKEWKPVYSVIMDYLVVLKRLYGCQFHFKLDIQNIGPIEREK